MIEFIGVSRSFGDRIAVQDLNLQVAAGSLFALLGPNGAGKTTAIKMLVGLLRPTVGQVRVCGQDVAADPRASNRLVAYVPDEPHLYDKLTGREFLTFVAEMYGLSTAYVSERIDREVERFGLSEFVDNLTESYSHGMKQRTVFAAALLHDPAVLVVDEPMVGLDPQSVRMVKDLLRELAAAGTTVFMSTHTLDVAEQIAGMVGILTAGKLEFLGTLAELREQTRMQGRSLEEAFLRLTGEPRGHSSDFGQASGSGSGT